MPAQQGFFKIGFVVALLLYVTVAAAQPQFKGFENLLTTPKAYVAAYTNTAPVIDGDITDAAWQQARWTENFVDIAGDPHHKPPFYTAFKMLWDDSCLYIAARVDEPQVWATLKRHDDIIFHDNDVEIFINPNNTTHQYFEIECNAINTIFDLFLNKPYRNGGLPMSNWDAKGMRSAVKVLGTLNNPADVDKGWTLEMSIPFKALTLGNRTQVPAEGTLWRINFSRVEWETNVVNGKYLKARDSAGRNLPEHNWVWSPQGLINMHYPERWGYLQFTKNTAAREFILPQAERQKQYLWWVYYKQKAWIKKHGAYAAGLAALAVDTDAVIDGTVSRLQMEATPHQFMVLITDKKDNITYTINQEGLVTVLDERFDD